MTALVLLGRRLEARARRRSGAAIRALLSLGAKDVVRGGGWFRIHLQADGQALAPWYEIVTE